MKCVKLTARSWLIGFGTEQAGLLFNNGTKYLYLSPSKRIEFESIDKVTEKFGNLINEELKSNKQDVMDINQYPVKHTDAVIYTEDPPRYTKGGNTIYAAGYWGIKYTSGWALAFCPKQDTIQSYETTGPFRHRLEALNQINRMNHLNHIASQGN